MQDSLRKLTAWLSPKCNLVKCQRYTRLKKYHSACSSREHRSMSKIRASQSKPLITFQATTELGHSRWLPRVTLKTMRQDCLWKGSHKEDSLVVIASRSVTKLSSKSKCASDQKQATGLASEASTAGMLTLKRSWEIPTRQWRHTWKLRALPTML